MRTPWSRGDTSRRWPEPRGGSVDPIDSIEPETLEVIDGDADVPAVGTFRWPTDDGPHELAERPTRRDPTGTAGIWEALGHS